VETRLSSAERSHPSAKSHPPSAKQSHPSAEQHRLSDAIHRRSNNIPHRKIRGMGKRRDAWSEGKQRRFDTEMMQREGGDGERWRMTGDEGRGRQRAFLGEGTPIGGGASFLWQSDVRSWRSSAILAISAKLSGGRTTPSGDRTTPFPDGVAPSNRKIPLILGAVTPSLSEATPYDGERLPFPADWHPASAE